MDKQPNLYKQFLKDIHPELLDQFKRFIKEKDIYNVIYTLKWVDGMKVESIVDITGYSRSQVYNIIRQLTRQLERG